MYNPLAELFFKQAFGRDVDLHSQLHPEGTLERHFQDNPIKSVDVYFRRLGDMGYSHRRITAT